MAAGNFRDFTGQAFPNGWVVTVLVSTGGGKVTIWEARHKCGHAQHVRIDQLRSGRESLCTNCGKRNERVMAARVASGIAATRRRKESGPSLMETIAKTRRAVDSIGRQPEESPRAEKAESTWDIIHEVQRLLDGKQHHSPRC
jgi:hypothetical protein